MSLPNLSEQRYVTQQSAAQDEAHVQGFDLEVQNNENDTSKQLTDINLAIAQKADGIVIHPNDETALAPAIDRAVSAGIPVVTIDKNVKGAQKLIPYIGVDYFTGGIEIARYVTNRFPNGAHIFFISGQPGNSITNDVGNGLRKGLGAASNIYKIVGQETGATNVEAGFTAMATFLEMYQKRPPEVVLAANDELAAGSSAALKEFGVPKGNVTLIDFGDNNAFDKIADGTLSATVNFLPKKVVKTALVAVLKNIRTGAPIESLELQPILADSSTLERAKLADNLELPLITPSPKPTATVEATPRVNDPRQVTLLYATNRKRRDTGESTEVPVFSSERSPNLTFGSAIVRLPENHTPGNVERPQEKWFLFLPLGKESEDYKKHFVLLNLGALSKEEFSQFIRNTQTSSVLLFVHGFNTSFQDALFRLAQIKFDTQYQGVPIVFSWPSSNGELNPTAYYHDRESADYSTDAFLEVIRLLKTDARVSQIYIIAHSMGNQVVLNAIDKASQGAEPPSLAELVLAEPDVDWDYFMRLGHLLTAVAKGVTLYASSTDTALLASEGWNGESHPRAGFIGKMGPLLLPPIETIDVTALGPDILSLTFNHGVAFGDKSVLGDIGRLLTGGKHPPNIRSDEIRGVPEGSSTPRYWKYP